MGSTSNYSWPTPEATDLVKDGWDAIKDLGDAADTTVKSVADGRGLVHINTTNYSAVSSISVNNVFTTDYNTFLIVAMNSASGSNVSFSMRLRASGSDDSTSNYYLQSLRSNDTTTTSSRLTVQTSWLLGQITSANNSMMIEITKPAATERTQMMSRSGIDWYDMYFRTAQLDTNTAYDGFTLFPAAGNVSGVLQVYGYRK